MNTNYINVIRNSLNIAEDKPKLKKRNKRIVIPLCNYSSTSEFVEDADILLKKKKIKLEKKESVKKNKNKGSKKEHTVTKTYKENPMEFSLTDEPVLTPSKSEIALRENNLKVQSDNEKYNSDLQLPSVSNSTSQHLENCLENYEQDSEFELDEFSNSRDHYPNESITEAYSAIEDEFVTTSVKKVKVKRNKILTSDTMSNLSGSNFNNSINLEHCAEIYSGGKKTSKNISKVQVSDSIQLDNDQDHNGNEECHEDSESSLQINMANEPTLSTCDPNSNNIYDEYGLHSYSDKQNNSNEECHYQDSEALIQMNMEDEPTLGTYDSNSNKSHAEYLDFENFKIVILKSKKYVSIFGYCCLKVIKGQIEILGRKLDVLSSPSNIFSPRGYSLVVIKNVSSDDESAYLKDLYEFPNSSDEILNTIVDSKSAAFLCYKMYNATLTFTEKYISQTIFPKVNNENLPRVVFEPKGMPRILENDEWENIIKIVNISTKLFIAGGKGVGKSTLLRYAINKLLSKFDTIRVIDLDPGQSEFFMPGCISVMTISEECIGPNFTHIMKPERSYLCDISVRDPATFIKNVQCLMQYVSQLDKMPTLINYMGYSKGIGIKIASSVIALVQPTNVVQIQSHSKNKNFVCDLNISNIKNHCRNFGGDVSALNYRVHKIMSRAEKIPGWKLDHRQAREMCIIAYLGEGMTESIDSLTDHNLPMYRITLSTIQLTNLLHKKISAAAVNANLVALCVLDEFNKTFICHGFGVVRGVDLENDYLVLLTPVNSEILNQITHLVLSSISLPPSIYMTPQNIRGLMPYVMEGGLTSLAQLTKRSYLPASHTTVK